MLTPELKAELLAEIARLLNDETCEVDQLHGFDRRADGSLERRAHERRTIWIRIGGGAEQHVAAHRDPAVAIAVDRMMRQKQVHSLSSTIGISESRT